jgi:hypothetical protein
VSLKVRFGVRDGVKVKVRFWGEDQQSSTKMFKLEPTVLVTHVTTLFYFRRQDKTIQDNSRQFKTVKDNERE